MQDRVMPEGKWAFDAEVADAFDDMLRRSIPQYDVMRKACFDLGCRHVRRMTDIVDLGCSRGEAIDPFLRRYGAQNRFVGVEVSPPMLEVAKERFRGYCETGVMRLLDFDLRTGYPAVQASLTLCCLTLQFTPIEYRHRIIRDACKSTLPGGAFILVEKVIGHTSEIDESLVGCYYDLKAENGYSQEAIDRKRLSLEGVLVPVTAKWNEELLRVAGFSAVDCFWRWMNFAAWIAIKE
jgi:tRNA (cmo5U34)-methyltransferase